MEVALVVVAFTPVKFCKVDDARDTKPLVKVARPVWVVAPEIVKVPMLAIAEKKFVDDATVEKNDVEVAFVKLAKVENKFVDVAEVEVEKPLVK